MDGFEVLKKLRVKHTIPIIAISANAMSADIKKAKIAGFDDYLSKPLDINNFFTIIDRYDTSNIEQ